ncbi:MAG: NnrS family protein, partial [Gammaproteobacteria bacterium]
MTSLRGSRSLALFSYAFRPFFLAAAMFAIVAVGLWIAVLVGVDVGVELDVFWHVHEMLFGFVVAAMAGFLLTAIASWTQRAPVSGAHLALLVLLWLAARIAMALLWVLPSTVTLVIGGAFSWFLTATVAVELVASRNRRNYPFILLLFALSLLDSLHIAGYVYGWLHALLVVQVLTPHLVVVF